MHPLILLCTTALGLTSATLLHHRQAFDPEETTGAGSNCIEAFGPGYVECVPASASAPRLCVNPDQGEKCCNNLCTSRTSPEQRARKLTLSPRGLPRVILLPRARPLLPRCRSPPYPYTPHLLTREQGLSPETCATENDVTLPPGFVLPSGNATAPDTVVPDVTIDDGPEITTAPVVGGNFTGNRTAGGRGPVVTAGAGQGVKGGMGMAVGLLVVGLGDRKSVV